MYEKSAMSPQPNNNSPQIRKQKSEQDSLPSGSVLQARAIFERKEDNLAENDQRPTTSVEHHRKRQNKNIQSVLATWTQKEQDCLRSSSQKDDENKRMEVSGIKVEKQKLSKESLRATPNQEIVVEDLKEVQNYTRMRQSRRRDPVVEDNSSSFQNVSDHDAENASAEKGIKIGTERELLDETQESESRLRQKPTTIRNQGALNEIAANEKCDNNDQSDIDAKKESNSRYSSVFTSFTLDQNLALYSTDEFEYIDQLSDSSGNCKLYNDLPDQSDGRPDGHQRGASRELHVRAPQMPACTSHIKPTTNKSFYLQSIVLENLLVKTMKGISSTILLTLKMVRIWNYHPSVTSLSQIIMILLKMRLLRLTMNCVVVLSTSVVDPKIAM